MDSTLDKESWDQIEIPSSRDEVTPAWLTSVLANSVAEGSLSVRSLDVQEVLAGTGGGFFADLLWLRPHYDAKMDSLPHVLVMKRPRGSADALLTSRYERETNFYRNLAHESPVRTPRCYFARFDSASGQFAILLEGIEQMKPGDDLQGCTLEEAEAAVLELARHHARFWLQEDLEATLISNAVPWQPPSPKMWASLLQDFADRLPSSIPETVETLQVRLPALLSFMARSPHTLLHGDFRLDNILFGDSSPGRPEIVLLDWQMARSGRAPADLAWMLGLGLDTEPRRHSQDRLLRTYHSELICNGVDAYDFDDCLRDFRLSLLTTLSSAALGWSVRPRQGKGLEKFTAFVRRVLHSVADNDALDALKSSVR